MQAPHLVGRFYRMANHEHLAESASEGETKRDAHQSLRQYAKQPWLLQGARRAAAGGVLQKECLCAMSTSSMKRSVFSPINSP